MENFEAVQEKFHAEIQKWKHVFVICFALNLLAYGMYITHITYAVDDYTYIYNKVDSLGDGRWMNNFIHNIVFQTSFMPTLMPIVSIGLYILTGIGLCKLWKLQRKHCFGVVALFTLHPYLLDAYNFRLATFGFALAYLLGITSLILTMKNKWGFIIGAILFYLALSRYQAVIGFAITAIMFQMLFINFRESFSVESLRHCLKLMLRYSLMLGIAVIGYLITIKLIFLLLDTHPNSRIQAGLISNFDQLKTQIGIIISVFIVRLGPIKEFVLPFVGKVGIFVIYIAAILTVLKKTSRLWTTLGTLLWIGLIPLGAICFMLPLAVTSLPWRICIGLVVFAAGMFALTQESGSLLIRRIGIIMSIFLITYFILNNNSVLYKQCLVNQRDLIMGNRIIAKMQSLEGYRPGMELAVVGKIKKEDFSKEGKGNLEIIREYVNHCSTRRYSMAQSAFEGNKGKYALLLNHMDLELKQCSKANFKRAVAFSQTRKPWPDPSSVFIQDGLVVLKLSEIDE